MGSGAHPETHSPVEDINAFEILRGSPCSQAYETRRLGKLVRKEEEEAGSPKPQPGASANARSLADNHPLLLIWEKPAAL